MPFTQIVIHMGTHKTGTTTVQEVLAAHRTWLRGRGFNFPHLPGCGASHNNFAHQLAIESDLGVSHLRAQVRAAHIEGTALVLSAEAFSVRILGERHWEGFDRSDYRDRRRAYLQRLREVFSDFDQVRVLLCYRRHEEYATSLYATNLLSDRYRWTFREFVDRCFPIFDYAAQLALFREVFEDVRTIPFETLKSDLVPQFFRWAELPLPPSTNLRTKVTPDMRVIAWLCEFRQRPVSRTEQACATEFARGAVAARIFSEAPRASLWASDEERRAFLKACTGPEPGFFPESPSEHSGRPVVSEDLAHVGAVYSGWRRSRFVRPKGVLPLIGCLKRRLLG